VHVGPFSSVMARSRGLNIPLFFQFYVCPLPRRLSASLLDYGIRIPNSFFVHALPPTREGHVFYCIPNDCSWWVFLSFFANHPLIHPPHPLIQPQTPSINGVCHLGGMAYDNLLLFCSVQPTDRKHPQKKGLLRGVSCGVTDESRRTVPHVSTGCETTHDAERFLVITIRWLS
jgi:hypothetical protein